MKLTKYSFLLFTGMVVFLFCSPLFAQTNDDSGNDSGDDPTRGVARISVIAGDVNVKRGDSGEIIAAAVNAPLVGADHLQTADGSKAEVQFDYANMVRLGPNTDLGFADVQLSRYQLQVAAGTVLYRVLRDSSAHAEIDTPSISVRPSRQGEYRITVLDNGDSEITVRSGEAEIYSPRGTQILAAGRTMIARGSPSDPEFQVVSAIARDPFDDWNASRDRELSNSRSYQYVSRDIYGAEDLDNYGTWVSSEYGPAWQPRVAAGWAPYRYGRWTWVDYYGWSWVSYDPWGWAPYHYGRWFNGRSGWCWYPGAIRQRYYWRPALVGFFGFGSGVSVGVGFGFGNIGWVPLAPRDPWRPWYGRGFYGRSPRVINNITVVNNTNITNIYRNARFNNGITAVNVNQFGVGRANFITARGADLSRAGLVRGQLPVTPTRASLQLSNRPAASMRFSPRVENRSFFTRSQPSQVTRVPFAQQQIRMQQMTGQIRGQGTGAGVSPAVVRQGNVMGSGANGAPNVGSQNPANNRQAWRTMTPGAGAANNTVNGFRGNGNGSTSGGWRRFGQPMNGAQMNSARVNGGNPSPNNGAVNSNSGTGNGFRGGSQNPQQQMTNPGAQQGMRRFGSPNGMDRQNPATGNTRSNPGNNTRSNDGWQRFGEPTRRGFNPSSGFDRNQQQRGVERGSSPSQGGGNRFRDQGADGARGGRGFGSNPQPLRINPPIVRERQDFGGSGRGSGRAPNMSAPRMSAPSTSGPRFGGPPSGGQRSGGGGSNSGSRSSGPSHSGHRGR